MINTSKLKGLMVERGMTQAEVSKAINISTASFQRKLKKGIFGSDEIEGMIKCLNIDNPLDIFFVMK